MVTVVRGVGPNRSDEEHEARVAIANDATIVRTAERVSRMAAGANGRIGLHQYGRNRGKESANFGGAVGLSFRGNDFRRVD